MLFSSLCLQLLMMVVADGGRISGSFSAGYQLKGLRAELKKGEAGALVGTLCRSSGRGKATGREWGEFTGDLMVPQGVYRELEEAHQGTPLGRG